ncbi:putative endo beta- protein [Botrytis fragariae]|uniref:Beta-xylanase n=1 Tax=Botrytis fragariae TaxID=1964551 RepID=A0A8H6AQD7_9HELO|nr:putative endo beta- protein [Botrytis fragariae]KAF5871901.1 putative endo beta- protein [Botrytis fragariae]
MHISNLITLAILPLAYGQLDTLAKAAGLKYFGSATDNGELTDTQYTAILSNNSQFGQITPGNTQKWQYIEPTQNTFSYTQGDVVVDFAEKNDQLLRCHNLCWYNQLPSWVTSGTWTNETLIAVLKNHIKNEVTYYKGKCYAWDVVNEAFNDDGTWRSFIFYDTIGPEYIPIAFETAALYDPDVKLYYNDYNIESSGAKATSALNLVKSLQARGIKIDGVGLQAHFIVGSTPSESALATTLKSFTALDVEVAYTELDVRFSTLPPTAAGLAQQGVDYANTVNACLSVDGCVGITIWDFTDAYSWIPSTFTGQGDACLWYANYTVHPAYNNVVAALSAAAGTAAPVTSTTVSTVPATSTSKVSISSAVSTSTSTPVVLSSSPDSVSVSASAVVSSISSVVQVASSSVAVSSAVSSLPISSSPIPSSSTLKKCTKTSSSTSAPSSTIISTTKTTSTAAASGTGAAVALYGQCGGATWTGSTVCASGATCVKQNDWYSQCLAA